MAENMRKLKINYVQALDDNFRKEYMKQDSFGVMMLKDAYFEIQVPDKCPICQYGIDMSIDNYWNFHDIHDDSKSFNIISIHSCPHCYNGFVIIHHMKIQKNGCVEKSQSVYPITASNLQINEDIRQISPEFYEIYNQCLIAKNDGLTQLYGMGFRKALEKLVTDFAINQNRDDADKILGMSLHNRIKTYFKDSDAKTALMACKWLGNNETHYENCNTNKDLQLFEDLIEDTLYYIHRELRQKEAKHINNTKGNKNYENYTDSGHNC